MLAFDFEATQTELGGLFYLINLGLFLELYADFTSPARPGIELPIWDFVALLGEDLLGPPVREDPIWVLLAELAGRGAAENPSLDLRVSLASRRSVPAKRWLSRMLPYLRRRLARALDLAKPEEVAKVLLHRSAEVYSTPTRIDVRFALAELPVEVRLSGLDRDPGWVPAAGRDIRFHFD